MHACPVHVIIFPTTVSSQLKLLQNYRITDHMKSMLNEQSLKKDMSMHVFTFQLFVNSCTRMDSLAKGSVLLTSTSVSIWLVYLSFSMDSTARYSVEVYS